MGDPLSVAAGVVGFVSLGIQVTTSLVQFYTSYTSQDSNVLNITQNLGRLLTTFQALEKALRDRKFRVDEQDILNGIEASLRNCEDLIEELQDETQKLLKAPRAGLINKAKTAGRKITYPFRQSTLQKLEEDIAEIRSNLSFAIDVLQIKDSTRSETDREEIRSLLELVSARQISSSIRAWLKAPDPTINHNEACSKRHPTSGLWFVKGSTYNSWLTKDNSFLWLNGFAGCGKSILCSTVIQYTFRYRRSNPQIGIAFFYFNFNDESKQDLLAMIRSLLLQLCSQLPGGQVKLAKLQAGYSHGSPGIHVLLDHLQSIIKQYKDVYIIIDALDESPKDSSRGSVLDTLQEMREWALKGFHLLVTSRDEPDIRDALEPSPEDEISLKNAGVDKDIANVITDRLDKDRRLRRWSASHDRIKDALTKGAQGVFRWVECQFKSLQDCPCSEHHLEKLLASLPRSLDETYERMLCNIDETLVEDARRILTLLCFASRPLTIYEIIDGIAVDVGGDGNFACSRRLKDGDDIHRICPGLVEIGLGIKDSSMLSEEMPTPTVYIAHFSVQEFLESERIMKSKAATFSIKSAQAHEEIARICLIYLCEPQMSNIKITMDIVARYPLSIYAATFWYHHYKSTAGSGKLFEPLLFDLFTGQHNAFEKWVRLSGVDEVFGPNDLVKLPSPIYYASLLGLTDVFCDILEHELRAKIQVIESQSNSSATVINAQCGAKYGNALQAASVKGHESMVQILLAEGADINTKGGYYGYALQAACKKGHRSVVQLLLTKGADVNAPGGAYGNALQAASHKGHETVVQLLLANGADVNTQGQRYGNALERASGNGYESIVQLLLASGADVNTQGQKYGNALERASGNGYESIVQLLLINGADPNAQSEDIGNALQAASLRGHEGVVKLLLARGADINAQGGRYRNAVSAARAWGHNSIMQMLLAKGAHFSSYKYQDYVLSQQNYSSRSKQ